EHYEDPWVLVEEVQLRIVADQTSRSHKTLAYCYWRCDIFALSPCELASQQGWGSLVDVPNSVALSSRCVPSPFLELPLDFRKVGMLLSDLHQGLVRLIFLWTELEPIVTVFI
ncbi:hypothetical protein PIB30_095441, partial [Stylosanthes scabra]|nr:hypothetical protein [Stylosanthes scabra]